MLSYIDTITIGSFNKEKPNKIENITIDSKSGYSGAGKNLKKNLNIKIFLAQLLPMELKIIDIFVK